MVILKANPGILKCSGGIKIRKWLCVERKLFKIWKQRKIRRNVVRQKRC